MALPALTFAQAALLGQIEQTRSLTDPIQHTAACQATAQRKGLFDLADDGRPDLTDTGRAALAEYRTWFTRGARG